MPQDRLALPDLRKYVSPPAENGGRPRVEFTDKEYDQLKNCLAVGATEIQAIESMGYSRHILQDRKKTDVRFRDALIQGKSTGILSVCHAQFASAVAGSVQAQQNYLRAKDPLTWIPEAAAVRALEERKIEEADGDNDRIEFVMTIVPGLPRPGEGEVIGTQDSGD